MVLALTGRLLDAATMFPNLGAVVLLTGAGLGTADGGVVLGARLLTTPKLDVDEREDPDGQVVRFDRSTR